MLNLSNRRVVVTGLGIVSPVGLNLKETWTNIVAGKSGVALIDTFDTTEFPSKIAATVKGFDATTVIPAKDLKKMDTFIHYGLFAADEALKDSALEITEENAERVGVAIGSGIGGLPMIEANDAKLNKGGPRRISPFFVPGSIINMISGNFSIRYGAKGPNISIVTACSTGTHSIGESARIIAYGDADVMFAGGAEMASSPLGIGGFLPPGHYQHAMTILRRQADPGTKIVTVLYWVTALVCLSWKSTNMPENVVQKYMLKLPVLVITVMLII